MKTGAKADKPARARDLIALYGQDEMIRHIEHEGWSILRLADDIGVSRASLTNWIDADSDRAKAFSRAFEASADAYADMAEMELKAIGSMDTQADVARQRELSQLHRWRAKMLNRRVYGDQAVIEHRETPAAEMSDAEIDSELARLRARAAEAPATKH